MSAELSYPVFVEHTERWLVWVEADSAEQAADYVNHNQELYEYVSDADRLDGDMTATAPKRDWEWQDVYGWEAKPHDAHVRAHRAELDRRERVAQQKACIAEEHPDREKPLLDGRQWCKRCHVYLPADTAMPVGGAR